MNSEERLTVDSYLFMNDADVKVAEEEKKKIEYLETKIDYNNIEVTLKIYEKAIKEKIFKTPIGYDYLNKMRGEMMKRGMPVEKIPPIRLFKNFSQEEDNKPIRILQVKGNSEDNKELLRFSLWMNIALFLLVVGMLFITLLGENTNILNYRYKLENDYAIWEQELTEKEAELLEREKALEGK